MKKEMKNRKKKHGQKLIGELQKRCRKKLISQVRWTAKKMEKNKYRRWTTKRKSGQKPQVRHKK